MSRTLVSRLLPLAAVSVISCKDSTAPQVHSAPAVLEPIGITTLTAVVAGVVDPAPSVRVSNDSGRALSGVEVRFGIESGGGSTQISSARTDNEGRASVGRWTVGTTTGQNVLTATVTGLPAVRFIVSAFPDKATSLKLVSGNNQSDTTRAVLGIPLVLRAQDRFGNVVPAAVVQFTTAPNGGSLAPAPATTDAQGLATAHWTLGPSAGFEDARAQLEGLDSTAIVLHATVKWPTLLVTQLSAGYNHNCAIMPEQRLECWGDNYYGQIGDGTTVDRSVAVTVASGTAFTQVAAGGTLTCALTTAGEAQCWGSNHWGQLGDGTNIDHATPRPIAGGLRFVQLVAGSEHACGRTSDGEVYCWGFMNQSSATTSSPVKVSGPTVFRSIATGSYLTCGIDDSGATQCFGGYDWHPSPVAGAPQFVALSGGLQHMCGLTAIGAAYCWGSGPLGNGSSDSTATPVPVSGSHVFRSIHSGYDWMCGVTVDGKNFCWGHSSWGAFGVESTPPFGSLTPVEMPLPAGVEFTSLAGGFYHMCGIAKPSTAYCWAAGFDGQLGDGVTAETDEFHHRPTPDVVWRR